MRAVEGMASILLRRSNRSLACNDQALDSLGVSLAMPVCQIPVS
jgi:hypothetical protein